MEGSDVFLRRVVRSADRYAPVGGCNSFDFVFGLWLESPEGHLPRSIAEVLRLRAVSRPCAMVLRGASLRMTVLWEVESIRLGVQKVRKGQKSHKLPEDGFVRG
jgi:hypothetical protein